MKSYYNSLKFSIKRHGILYLKSKIYQQIIPLRNYYILGTYPVGVNILDPIHLFIHIDNTLPFLCTTWVVHP